MLRWLTIKRRPLPLCQPVLCLGDLPNYFKAPKVNESVSRLLDRPIANSHYVSVSLGEMCKLETCIHGMIQSQSFSLWALVSAFAFLKDFGCAPEENVFHQLISSLQVSLNSQVKASFASTLFLMQKRWETLVPFPIRHVCFGQACALDHPVFILPVF